MRFPAAFDLERAAFPAPRADQAPEQLRVVAGDVAAFEPAEAVLGVLLPVPVGGQVGEAAKARFALAHCLLGVGAAQLLAHHGRHDLQGLLQALVRRPYAPAV